MKVDARQEIVKRTSISEETARWLPLSFFFTWLNPSFRLPGNQYLMQVLFYLEQIPQSLWGNGGKMPQNNSLRILPEFLYGWIKLK